jgi:hypothetical protein
VTGNKLNDALAEHRKPVWPEFRDGPGVTYRAETNAVREHDLTVVVVVRVEDTGDYVLFDPRRWKDGRSRLTHHSYAENKHWPERPKPSSHWAHFKGGTYRVVCNALDAVTAEHYVVYKSDDDGAVWARRATSWFHPVKPGGNEVPRFTRVV